MLINVILKTTEYRGDHSTDIDIAVGNVTPETTISELITKCFEEGFKGKIGTHIGSEITDHIEIRIAH
jgi:hypothetical protein